MTRVGWFMFLICGVLMLALGGWHLLMAATGSAGRAYERWRTRRG